jgi:hypothetical protein
VSTAKDPKAKKESNEGLAAILPVSVVKRGRSGSFYEEKAITILPDHIQKRMDTIREFIPHPIEVQPPRDNPQLVSFSPFLSRLRFFCHILTLIHRHTHTFSLTNVCLCVVFSFDEYSHFRSINGTLKSKTIKKLIPFFEIWCVTHTLNTHFSFCLLSIISND